MTDQADSRDRDRRFTHEAVEAGIRIALVALLVVWSFVIVRPFLVAILWGIVVAIAVYPFFAWLSARLGDRPRPTAVLLTLLGLALLLGPVSLLGAVLVENVQALTAAVDAGHLTIPPPPESVAGWPMIGKPLSAFWSLASTNLQEAAQQIEPQLKAASGFLLGVAASTGIGLLQLIFGVIIAGVLVTVHAGARAGTEAIARRLADRQGSAYVDLAIGTIRSVAKGVIGIAVLQAVLAGLGFLGAGLPAAGLLAFLVLLLSAIQVGPGLVVIPVLIYLWSTGDTLTAALFTAYIAPVSFLDNILKPFLMGRGLAVPMLVVFVGVLGGTIAHGILGLFIGPIVLGVGYQLFRAWLREGPPGA